MVLEILAVKTEFNLFKKYDVWSLVTLLLLGLYALFLIYPLMNLLTQSVVDKSTGEFTLAYFIKFFSKPYYFNTLLNSIKVTFCVTLLTVLLGTPLAYFFTRFHIKGKAFLRILIILSSMSAPFIGAYSWILLLGRSGVITLFFRNTIGIQFPSIYGFTGILIVLTLQLYPLIFLYAAGALKNVMALATGIAEGLGLGDNAKAATLARGLVEYLPDRLHAERFPIRRFSLARRLRGGRRRFRQRFDRRRLTEQLEATELELQQLAEEAYVRRDHALDREVVLDAPGTDPAHLGRKLRIAEEPVDTDCDRLRVCGRHEDAGVAVGDQLGKTAQARKRESMRMSRFSRR